MFAPLAVATAIFRTPAAFVEASHPPRCAPLQPTHFFPDRGDVPAHRPRQCDCLDLKPGRQRTAIGLRRVAGRSCPRTRPDCLRYRPLGNAAFRLATRPRWPSVNASAANEWGLRARAHGARPRRILPGSGCEGRALEWPAVAECRVTGYAGEARILRSSPGRRPERNRRVCAARSAVRRTVPPAA